MEEDEEEKRFPWRMAKKDLECGIEGSEFELWSRFRFTFGLIPLRKAWSILYLSLSLNSIVVYWPSTRPNMPFQRRRKWHILMASYWKKLRRRAWLTIWDKVKSRGTVTDWCTGREWPVNCMTVISAWWRSNMPFQRQRKWHIPMASYGEILSGRLNYCIARWRQEVSQFGDQTIWRQDVVEKASTRQKGLPGLWLSNPGERERHKADDHKSGHQYVAVLFVLQLPLTHNFSNKGRGIFF